MRLSRTAWPLFGASCLVLLASAACGSTAGSNVNGANGDGSGAGSGSGRAGKSGTGGPILGLGGDSATTTGGSSAVGPECAGDLIQAQRIPLDMYVMLDVSGSMLEATAGDAKILKWDAVSSALTDFVSDPASDGIGVGLQVFPIADPKTPAACASDNECGGTFGPCMNRGCWPLVNGTTNGCLKDSECGRAQTCVVIGLCSKDNQYACNRDATATCSAGRGTCDALAGTCLIDADCRSATYAAPAAEIALLPAAKAAVVKVLQASTPVEGALTPTGPALTGAIQRASDWAKAHPDHQVVAVLATDGMPTLETKGAACEVISMQSQVDAVAKIAANGAAAAPAVSTFVIGVIGASDTGATATLRAIAQSGGTKKAFIVDTMGNVQMQFRDALNQIRATGLSCELAVPQAEAGKTVDFGKVNVTFDNGSGPTDLGYVETAANCNATAGGWYYDVDPSAGTPKRIQTCPTTCAAFEKTDMGSVQIKLGCVTHDVVK